jgi:hypothetical protein
MHEMVWAGYRLEIAMAAIAILWAATMGLLYWQHCRRNKCLPPDNNTEKMVYWSAGYFVSIVVMVFISFLSHILA